MRRLLIVGCGDVGMRMLHLLRGRYRLYALSRSPQRHALLRSHGITPLPGDLDRPDSLARLAGLPHDVLHFAPPPSAGERDARTANLIRALRKARSIPQRLVYISTSGVYGDCGGDVVEEHAPLRPQTDRARRRVDAERQLRSWGLASGISVVILRVPGIYAADRLPLERLRSGTPALAAAEDGYSNHVHADDLARIVLAALARGRTQRAYNACDGDWLKMGDYFDLVAARSGLPAPARVSRQEAEHRLPETLMSFLRESRRLDNRRLRRELRLRLRYPTVAAGVAAAPAPGVPLASPLRRRLSDFHARCTERTDKAQWTRCCWC
jgi:nucleoside-diphosphate-sugar epimerase